MHQRMGLNLPFSKPSRKSCSRYCPSVRGRGTGPRSLAHSTARQRILPRSHRDLRRTQASTQSRKELKVLSLSSNQKQLRYGDRSNIFGRFPNGMAKTMLEMAW